MSMTVGTRLLKEFKNAKLVLCGCVSGRFRRSNRDADAITSQNNPITDVSILIVHKQ